MVRLMATPYPSCCGINIISGFGHSNNDPVKYSIKDIEAEVERIISHHGIGMYLAALNEHQIKVFTPMLKRLDFKPLVENFMHTGHGNTITMYAHIVHGVVEKTPLGKWSEKSVFPAGLSAVYS